MCVNSESKTVPWGIFVSSTNFASSKCSGRRPSSTISGAFVSLPCTRSGTSMSPIGVWNTEPFTRAGMKFMDGAPMNPATNRLTGCS
mgnify:CR=1 FL=1